MKGGTAKVLDGAIEAGLIGLLLFAPLPFGSILPWARSVIEGTVALLLALWGARMLAGGAIEIPRVPLLWPGIAMAGLIGLQLLLPWGSVHPHATWEGLRLYLAYFGVVLVLTAHLVTRARIVRLLSILIGWGVALAILGLVNHMWERPVILWFPKEAYLDRLTSTFVNPNHQALYFAVLFFLALGLLLRPRRRAPSSEGNAARRHRRAAEAGGLPGRVLLVGALALLGGALVLTMSRGGIASALAGLVVVFALSLHGRVGTWTLTALGGVFAVVFLYASWFGLDPVLARFSALAEEPFRNLRWPIWEATLRMAGDALPLGVGLGAFQEAFPLYRPPVIPANRLVDFAHNDYLQLLAETGLAGLLVLGWALLGLGAFVLRRWALRRDPFARGLTMGGLGALAAVAVHSATDFGLHIPANALLVAALGALLPVVVALRAHPQGDWVDLRRWSWEVTPRLRVAGMATMAGGLLVAGAVVAPPAIAGRYLQQSVGVVSGSAGGGAATSDLVRAHGALQWAARLDPWNPQVHAALARVSEELAVRVWNHGVTPDGRRLPPAPEERLGASQGLFAQAYGAYERSLGLRPRAAELHDRFGWFLGSLDTIRRSVQASSTLRARLDPRLRPLLDSEESLLPRALRHLREGARWDPHNAYRHRSLALFALAHLGDEPTRREVAAEGFRRALSLDPSLLAGVLDRLSSGNGDAELLQASLPPRYDLWLALGQHLVRQRRWAAVPAFEKALSLASDPAGQVEVRLAYSRALLQGNDPGGALAQAQQALILDPRNPEVFLALAEIYEARRQEDEAETALVSAVTLARGADAGQANRYRARLAALLSKRGEVGRALLLRRQILQATPNDPWAHLEVGRLLERRGEWAEAFREYRAAEGLGPRDVWLQWEVARAYARRGLLREAVMAYAAAVRLRPEAGDLRMELAELYARLGQREQAVEQYREVLVREPGHQGARRALAAATDPSGGQREP